MQSQHLIALKNVISNIMMLSIINDMPIIPMIAPMTNNSIITSIAPTKNSNTEIRLTSPLIKSRGRELKVQALR